MLNKKQEEPKNNWIQKVTSVGKKYNLDKHIKTVEDIQIDHIMIVKEMLGITGYKDPKILKKQFKAIVKEVHPDQAPEVLKESSRVAIKYITFLLTKF